MGAGGTKPKQEVVHRVYDGLSFVRPRAQHVLGVLGVDGWKTTTVV